MKYQYDMIINCVGFGEPKNLKDAGYKIFSVTESFDNLAIEYLSKINTNTLYINFSSGAVFGKEFFCPASMDSTNNILVNNITDKDFYGIAKINSEAKHRSLNNFYIVDIRVYSYISRFINLTSNFFVTDLINALKDKTKLLTNESDMVRDYVVQDDVYCLIIKCFKKRYLNDSFDIYSKKPCTKFELLDYFKSKHGLDYEIKYSEQANSPTGNKSSYFTDNFKAEKIGYYPSYTSIEGIEKEIKYLIK
jgi:nucleoside-diphosphate-sugar epimerase